MVGDIGESMHSLLEVSNGGNGASHVPAFLAKLWKIVDDPATDELICWSEMGNSFLIRNQSKFARELLPLYYKHNNMASFVRQLNMYGFHKVVSVDQGGLRTDKDEMEFAHPFFLRGSESTLELIKRKIPAAKLDETRGSRPETINKVLLDVRQMKGRQDSMDSKLLNVKRENEALWRELSILRQKHAKQQQIVSKLLQFLVGMMSSQSHRIGFKRRMHMSVPLMLNDTDGLKANKRNKNNGGELVGPVIRDVTDYINSSGRMLEDQSDQYQSQDSPMESDTHPKVDSPPSTSGRSPYSESIYPMSPYDDPDMLLSVDPLAINPSMDIKPYPNSAEAATATKKNKLQTNKIKAGGKKSSVNQGNKKATSAVVTTSNEAGSSAHSIGSPVSSSQKTTTNTSTTASQGKIDQSLPTLMYIPGIEAPIEVVLSIPETESNSTSTELVSTTTANQGVSISQPIVTDCVVPFTNTTAINTSQPSIVSITAVEPTPSPAASLPADAVETQVPSNNPTQRPKTKLDNITSAAIDNDCGSLSNEMVLAGLTSRQDLDGHLDDVQSGLDNLRELLKQDHYSIDQNTLMNLFGSDSDILLDEAATDNQVKDILATGSNPTGDGMNMVTYNPSLYELADDDSQFFDYQNSGGSFLDDPSTITSSLLNSELESMLTTDREKLRSKGELKGAAAGDYFSTT